MIYSRFGTEVEIVKHNKGSEYVTTRRIADGKEYVQRLSELQADGGIGEIVEALNRVSGDDEIPA